MNADPRADWSNWSQQWQTVDSASDRPSSELRHRVQSRGRILALWVTCEVTVAAIGVSVLAYWVVASPFVADRALMGLLALSCLAILVHTLWNWHGAWRHHAESQRTFLSLSLSRCTRVRRAVRAGWYLLGVEIACFVPWIAIRLSAANAPLTAYLPPYVVVAALLTGAVAYIVMVSRWVEREEVAIQSIVNEVEAGSDDLRC